MVEKKTKQNPKEKKGFWWWLLVIIAVLIILNALDKSDKLDDYTRCVEGCKSDLYCLEWDVQDTNGNWYMSHSNFESCRSIVFSCLDSCESRYGD